MATKGKRVQVYIPADLVEMWDTTPRYERSAVVAKALRAYWKIESDQDKPQNKPQAAPHKEIESGDTAL